MTAAGQETGDRGFGDVGEGGTRRIARKSRAQELNTDLELAIADPTPRQVEHCAVGRKGGVRDKRAAVFASGAAPESL